jgi:hypothetical protein
MGNQLKASLSFKDKVSLLAYSRIFRGSVISIAVFSYLSVRSHSIKMNCELANQSCLALGSYKSSFWYMVIGLVFGILIILAKKPQGQERRDYIVTVILMSLGLLAMYLSLNL